MLNNINLNYKEMWGDQKCIFRSPNKVAYGKERKREEKKRNEKKRKKEIKPRYGGLTLV